MDLAGFERSITFLCVMTPKLTYRPISYITFDTDETKGKDPRMKVWKVERYSVIYGPTPSRISKTGIGTISGPTKYYSRRRRDTARKQCRVESEDMLLVQSKD